MNGPAAPVARLERVTQRYGRVAALDDVMVAFPAGRMVGVIGPDGVGKSSLLAIIAGARQIQTGRVLVLDGDMAEFRASPRCLSAHRLHAARVWERTFIPTSASARISSSSPAYLGSPAPSESGASRKFWTARDSRHSPIVRPRSFRAACGRNSACAARSFTIPIF